MRLILLPLVACCALPAHASDVQSVLAEARAECAAIDNGTLTVLDGAVTEHDFNGDGAPDHVIDAYEMECSTGLSLFCGTGGCALTVIVDGVATPLLAKGWQTVETGIDTVLLLQVHGSACGGTNLNPCYEALVWDDGAGRFWSVMPPVQ